MTEQIFRSFLLEETLALCCIPTNELFDPIFMRFVFVSFAYFAVRVYWWILNINIMHRTLEFFKRISGRHWNLLLELILPSKT